MTFSFSRAPPKQKKAKPSAKVDLSSILEDLEANKVSRPRKRRRRRKVHNVEIATVAAIQAQKIDLTDLLDSPPSKPPAPSAKITVGPSTSIASAPDGDDESETENIPTVSVFGVRKSHARKNKARVAGAAVVSDSSAKHPASEVTSTNLAIPKLKEGELDTVQPDSPPAAILDSPPDDTAETACLDDQEDSFALDDDDDIVEIQAVSSVKDDPPIETSFEKLKESLDHLLVDADRNTVTIRILLNQLEEKHGKLDKSTCKVLKTRIRERLLEEAVGKDENVGENNSPKTPSNPTSPPRSPQASDNVAHASATGTRPVKQKEQPQPHASVNSNPSMGKQATRNTQKKPQKRKQAKKTEDARQASPKPPQGTKRPRKRMKQGTCSLCSTCQCTKIHNDGPLQIFGEHLAGQQSAIETEKALIRRQKKLEKTVDKYESDLDLVARELKKHRRLTSKKKEVQLNARREQQFLNSGEDSRFLPDVDEWDAHLEQIKREHKIPTVVVDQGQRKLFGNVARKQPTLTQMMRGDTDEKDVSTEVGPQEPPAEYQQQESDAISDFEDDENTSETEDTPIDVQRMSFRKGEICDDPIARIWGALTYGNKSDKMEHDKYDAAWDCLFTDELKSESMQAGFSELLGLFQTHSFTQQHQQSQSETSDLPTQVNMTQLSQSAQTVAKSIEQKIQDSDPEIETTCPKWKENIRFALAQQESGEVKLALQNVSEAQTKLDNMKKDFLGALNRQETILKVYSMSLSESLKRIDDEHTASDVDSVADECPVTQNENADATLEPEESQFLERIDEHVASDGNSVAGKCPVSENDVVEATLKPQESRPLDNFNEYVTSDDDSVTDECPGNGNDKMCATLKPKENNCFKRTDEQATSDGDSLADECPVSENGTVDATLKPEDDPHESTIVQEAILLEQHLGDVEELDEEEDDLMTPFSQETEPTLVCSHLT